MGDAGRVIAGSARGVRLAAPGSATRPLGARVKQAVFGALEPSLREAAVLDLCAGSGGAAIEALSRGSRVEREGFRLTLKPPNFRPDPIHGSGFFFVPKEGPHAPPGP